MTAGLNNTGRIWRFTASTNNDEIGGAVPTGTVLYTPVFSRIASERPTLALLEQGLETPEIFRAELSYVPYSPTGTFDVQHNDQYEVMYPPTSPFYQKRFVIIGIQHQSFNDARKFLRVTMRRIETANSDLLLNSVNQLNFDGVNDKIIIPASTSLNNLPTGNFTIEFVAGDFSSQTIGIIFNKSILNASSFSKGMVSEYYKSGGDVYIDFFVTYGNVSESAYFEAVLPNPLTIRHYAFVWNASTYIVKLYINGIELSLDNYSTPMPPSNPYDDDSAQNLIIGSLSTIEFASMNLRWLMISSGLKYTSSFTPPSLTLCPPAADATTLLRLALDERTGTIAHDSSKNANNGLIVGATWQVSE